MSGELGEVQLAGGATQKGVNADDYDCNDTGDNCDEDEFAVSVAGVTPARYVTWFQAQQFCRMAGKRLVTNAEWQAAAAGTPDGTPCVVDASAPALTGTIGCASAVGTFDMVGNVAEWTADWTLAANACSNDLFAGSSDSNCMTLDPAIPRRDGPAAPIRGGYFSPGGGVPVSIGRDAGVFAIFDLHQPSFTSLAVGFRCAR